jgi:3-phosphoshikimate 1-carboxyvinyltransferase
MDPLHCDDTIATVDGLRKLGINISNTEDWEIEGGKLSPPSSIINCNESGTTIRLLIGLTSLLDTSCTLTGTPSLLRRPNKQLLDALEQLGAQTKSNAGYPPITITGKIKGGRADISGNISSQFISSILLAAPYSESPVELNVTTPLESKSYVQMTLDTMKKSGIKVKHSENLEYFKIPNEKYIPQKTRIEGDWSSATYMLAAGALAGKVQVDNLDLSSSQADTEIISIMNEMGANIKIKENRVAVKKSKLNAINVDMSDFPDLFPMVACLCSVAEGTSKLTGLTRLKIKESDRMAATIEGLKKMGIEVSGDHDSVKITGGLPHGAVINTHNDHRIAMSFAILSHTAEGESTIMNPECVSKSYPDFWETLTQIGAKIR